MASAFNLTAQLNLRGPSNVNKIVADIKKQLTGINANVNFKLDPNAAKNIAGLNTAFRAFNTTLQTTQKNASNAAAALNALAQSVGAINIKTVSSSASQATANLTKMTKAATETASSLTQSATEMQEFGKQAGLAVRRFAAFSAVTGVIYGLTNSISQGVQAYLDYDKELVRLQQVTGETAGGLGVLQKSITSLATSLGVSSKELTTVSVTLAQAGLTAKDTERALRALALSSLAPSFDDMNETVEGSIALMRQFGIGANQLEQALGSVNAVAAAFAVEADDLITAIQRTGGVFATASKGVSEGTDALNEFIAVFTSIRATTRESAETIATGLRTIFTRIQRGSTIDALKEFGVNLTDTEGKFVGAYKAVELLSQGLSKLDPRDIKFSRIVEELGGFRQIGKVIPLIQQFSVAQDALKVAQAGQGSLAKDAATAQLALANQIQKVREEFFALFREIGQSKGFQSLISGVLTLTSGLIKLADVSKGLLPALSVIMAFKGASALTQFASGFSKGFRPGGNKKDEERPRFAEGGVVRYFAKGGSVPGSGSRDTVPAMLTPGEFVVNRKAASKIGQRTLSNINKYADGGLVQKFAGGGVAQRKVGYIDYDVIANDANKNIVEKGMEETGQKGPRLYTDYLTQLAVKARKDSNLEKLRAVYGVAGSGKTTLARGQGTDDAVLRKTERFPILSPKDIQNATEVIVLSSSVGKDKLDSIFSNTDRTYTLSSTTKREKENIQSQRISRDITGVGLEGRGPGATLSAANDTATGEALLTDRLGSRSVVLGRTDSGRLRRKSDNELVDIIKKKIGFTWGGFAPMTAGHESIMDAASAMGYSPEDFIYLVGSNEGVIAGKQDTYRTAVFDQDSRLLLAKAGAGARGATVLPKPKDFEVPQAFDISDKDRRRVIIPDKNSRAFVADKTTEQMKKYTEAGYAVTNLERTGGISGTMVRKLIAEGNLGELQKVLSPGVYELISNNIGRIQNRANVLPSIVNEVEKSQVLKLNEVEKAISALGITRIDNKKVESDPEYAAKVEVLKELRSKRDKIKSAGSFEPYRLLAKLAEKEPEKYGLNFNIPSISDIKPVRTVKPRTQKANLGGIIQRFAGGGNVYASKKKYGMLIPDMGDPPDHDMVRASIGGDQYVAPITVSGFTKTKDYAKEAKKLPEAIDSMAKGLAKTINRPIEQSAINTAKSLTSTASGKLFEGYVLSAANLKDPGTDRFDIPKTSKYLEGLTTQPVSDLTDIKLSDSIPNRKSIIEKAVATDRSSFRKSNTIPFENRGRPRKNEYSLGGLIQKFMSGGVADESDKMTDAIAATKGRSEILKVLRDRPNGLEDTAKAVGVKSSDIYDILGTRSPDAKTKALQEAIRKEYVKTVNRRSGAAKATTTKLQDKGFEFGAAGVFGTASAPENIDIVSDRLSRSAKVRVVSGVMDRSIAEQLDTLLTQGTNELVTRAARLVKGSEPTGSVVKDPSTEASMQGILLEQIIQQLGGPGKVKGQGFDFPDGLQEAAKYFGLPSDIPTDLKRTLTGASTIKDNIVTYLKNVQGYAGGGKVDYYSLEKNSGFKPGEFDLLANFAKSNGFSLDEFKKYLQQRLAQKQQNSQLRMNPASVLRAITPEAPRTTDKQRALAEQLKGEPDAGYRPILTQAQRIAQARSDVNKSIQGFANGGTVQALLTPGEAVISPKMARQIGYGKLSRMNRADRNGMGRYASGGGVGIVPGSGNTDSFGPVPLPVGSFVIRKKATQALGFNKGGSVIKKFAAGGATGGGSNIMTYVMDWLKSDMVAKTKPKMASRPDNINEDTVKASNDTVQSLDNLVKSLNKLGISASESAKILNKGGDISYATIEKALSKDVERLKVSNSSIDSIVAAETVLADIRQKNATNIDKQKNLEGLGSVRGKSNQKILGGSLTVGDLQKGSSAGQQAIDTQAKMIAKSRVEKLEQSGTKISSKKREQILDSSYLQAASKISGIKKDEFKKAGISGSDIQSYIAESMKDRKTLSQMDKQLIAMRMEEYKNAGTVRGISVNSAKEAEKLAQEEISIRRQTINDLAAQKGEKGVGAAGMFDFRNSPALKELKAFFSSPGRVMGGLSTVAGLAAGSSDMIAKNMYNMSTVEGQGKAARTSAAIQSSGTILSTGMAAASQMAAIPGIGPYAAAITAIGTAALTAADYFGDFTGAQKAATVEFERSIRAKEIGMAMDELDRAFQNFEKDLSNIDLQQALEKAIGRASGAQINDNITERDNARADFALKNRTWMDILSGNFKGSTKMDAVQEGAMNSEMSQKMAAISGKALALYEKQINQGKSIEDIVNEVRTGSAETVNAGASIAFAAKPELWSELESRIKASGDASENNRIKILREITARELSTNVQLQALEKMKKLADAMDAADRAGRKLAASFRDLTEGVNQVIGRIQQESQVRQAQMNSTVEARRGNASFDEKTVNNTNIGVLTRPKAFKNDPARIDNAIKAGTAGLSPEVAKKLAGGARLEITLPDIMRKAVDEAAKSSADVDIAKVSQIASKKAEAAIDASGLSDEDKATAKVKILETIKGKEQEITKEGGDSPKVIVDKFAVAMSDLGDEMANIFGNAGRTLDDIIRQRQDTYNTFSKNLETAADAARKARDYFNKARDIKYNANMDLREAQTGVSESYDEAKAKFDDDIKRLTGGLNDPQAIGKNIDDLVEQRNQQTKDRDTAMSDPNFQQADAEKFAKDIQATNNAINDNKEALDKMANSAELAQKALDEIKNIRGLQQNRENFVNQLLTNTPEEADKLNQSFIRLQRNLSGGLNNANNQRDAKNAFNDTLRRTGNLREATRAGNTVLADQRKQTLQLMQDPGFRGMMTLNMKNQGMSDEQIDKNFRYQEGMLMQQMAKESGLINNPMVQQALAAKADPNADPAMKKAADQFLQSTGLQAKANEEQGRLELANVQSILVSSTDDLRMSIDDLNKNISNLLGSGGADVGGERVPGPAGDKVALGGRARGAAPIGVTFSNTGGLIKSNKVKPEYASFGKLIDFKSKGTDTVPAMLSPGEFVINARSTAQNLPLLQAINNGSDMNSIKTMSRGGIVYLSSGGSVKLQKDETLAQDQAFFDQNVRVSNQQYETGGGREQTKADVDAAKAAADAAERQAFFFSSNAADDRRTVLRDGEIINLPSNGAETAAMNYASTKVKDWEKLTLEQQQAAAAPYVEEAKSVFDTKRVWRYGSNLAQPGVGAISQAEIDKRIQEKKDASVKASRIASEKAQDFANREAAGTSYMTPDQQLESDKLKVRARLEEDRQIASGEKVLSAEDISVRRAASGNDTGIATPEQIDNYIKTRTAQAQRAVASAEYAMSGVSFIDRSAATTLPGAGGSDVQTGGKVYTVGRTITQRELVDQRFAAARQKSMGMQWTDDKGNVWIADENGNFRNNEGKLTRNDNDLDILMNGTRGEHYASSEYNLDRMTFGSGSTISGTVRNEALSAGMREIGRGIVEMHTPRTSMTTANMSTRDFSSKPLSPAYRSPVSSPMTTSYQTSSNAILDSVFSGMSHRDIASQQSGPTVSVQPKETEIQRYTRMAREAGPKKMSDFRKPRNMGEIQMYHEGIARGMTIDEIRYERQQRYLNRFRPEIRQSLLTTLQKDGQLREPSDRQRLIKKAEDAYKKEAIINAIKKLNHIRNNNPGTSDAYILEAIKLLKSLLESNNIKPSDNMILGEPSKTVYASRGKLIQKPNYASSGKLIDFKPKGTDTVPAMLSPGEFVINARATAQHLPLLQAINSGADSTVAKVMSKGGVVYLAEGGEARTRKDMDDKLATEREEVAVNATWQTGDTTEGSQQPVPMTPYSAQSAPAKDSAQNAAQVQQASSSTDTYSSRGVAIPSSMNEEQSARYKELEDKRQKGKYDSEDPLTPEERQEWKSLHRKRELGTVPTASDNAARLALMGIAPEDRTPEQQEEYLRLRYQSDSYRGMTGQRRTISGATSSEGYDRFKTRQAEEQYARDDKRYNSLVTARDKEGRQFTDLDNEFVDRYNSKQKQRKEEVIARTKQQTESFGSKFEDTQAGAQANASILADAKSKAEEYATSDRKKQDQKDIGIIEENRQKAQFEEFLVSNIDANITDPKMLASYYAEQTFPNWKDASPEDQKLIAKSFEKQASEFITKNTSDGKLKDDYKQSRQDNLDNLRAAQANKIKTSPEYESSSEDARAKMLQEIADKPSYELINDDARAKLADKQQLIQEREFGSLPQFDSRSSSDNVSKIREQAAVYAKAASDLGAIKNINNNEQIASYKKESERLLLAASSLETSGSTTESASGALAETKATAVAVSPDLTTSVASSRLDKAKEDKDLGRYIDNQDKQEKAASKAAAREQARVEAQARAQEEARNAAAAQQQANAAAAAQAEQQRQDGMWVNSKRGGVLGGAIRLGGWFGGVADSGVRAVRGATTAAVGAGLNAVSQTGVVDWATGGSAAAAKGAELDAQIKTRQVEQANRGVIGAQGTDQRQALTQAQAAVDKQAANQQTSAGDAFRSVTNAAVVAGAQDVASVVNAVTAGKAEQTLNSFGGDLGTNIFGRYGDDSAVSQMNERNSQMLKDMGMHGSAFVTDFANTTANLAFNGNPVVTGLGASSAGTSLAARAGRLLNTADNLAGSPGTFIGMGKGAIKAADNVILGGRGAKAVSAVAKPLIKTGKTAGKAYDLVQPSISAGINRTVQAMPTLSRGINATTDIANSIGRGVSDFVGGARMVGNTMMDTLNNPMDALKFTARSLDQEFTSGRIGKFGSSIYDAVSPGVSSASKRVSGTVSNIRSAVGKRVGAYRNTKPRDLRTPRSTTTPIKPSNPSTITPTPSAATKARVKTTQKRNRVQAENPSEAAKAKKVDPATVENYGRRVFGQKPGEEFLYRGSYGSSIEEGFDLTKMGSTGTMYGAGVYGGFDVSKIGQGKTLAQSYRDQYLLKFIKENPGASAKDIAKQFKGGMYQLRLKNPELFVDANAPFRGTREEGIINNLLTQSGINPKKAKADATPIQAYNAITKKRRQELMSLPANQSLSPKELDALAKAQTSEAFAREGIPGMVAYENRTRYSGVDGSGVVSIFDKEAFEIVGKEGTNIRDINSLITRSARKPQNPAPVIPKPTTAITAVKPATITPSIPSNPSTSTPKPQTSSTATAPKPKVTTQQSPTKPISPSVSKPQATTTAPKPKAVTSTPTKPANPTAADSKPTTSAPKAKGSTPKTSTKQAPSSEAVQIETLDKQIAALRSQEKKGFLGFGKVSKQDEIKKLVQQKERIQRAIRTRESMAKGAINLAKEKQGLGASFYEGDEWKRLMEGGIPNEYRTYGTAIPQPGNAAATAFGRLRGAKIQSKTGYARASAENNYSGFEGFMIDPKTGKQVLDKEYSKQLDKIRTSVGYNTGYTQDPYGGIRIMGKDSTNRPGAVLYNIPADEVTPELLEKIKKLGIQKFNKGGIVYANNGALIDARPQGTDTVPAMLTPGEFVVNRQSAQQHMPLLNAINSGSYSRGGIVNYMANGGLVIPHYLEGGSKGPLPSASVVQGGGVSTNVGIDTSAVASMINGLQKTVNDLASSIPSMSQVAENITSSIGLFVEGGSQIGDIITNAVNPVVQGLAQVNIPDTINVAGTLESRHTFNGAEAANRLIDTMGPTMEQQTNNQIGKFAGAINRGIGNLDTGVLGPDTGQVMGQIGGRTYHT